MMGNRGSVNADEYDAFNRHARSMYHWKRGSLRKIKRNFSKRMRQLGKLQNSFSGDRDGN